MSRLKHFSLRSINVLDVLVLENSTEEVMILILLYR